MGIFSKLKSTKVEEAKQNAKAELVVEKEAKKPKVEKAKVENDNTTSKVTGDAYRVLKRAILSEKASVAAEQNKYTFEVTYTANKSMVKDAIYKVYGVRPKAVHIITMRGKAVRFGRMKGKRKDWKKAIVAMPEGTKIEIYEGV